MFEQLDKPNAQWIRDLLSDQYPFKVLFCHSCTGSLAHDLYKIIAPRFDEVGLDLLCDPFPAGTDVWVAMESLRVHGIVLHATHEANLSKACQLELSAAVRKRLPLGILEDGGRLDESQRKKAFVILAGSMPDPSLIKELAIQVSKRVRMHWVIEWTKTEGRSVHEREAAADWLCEQESQLIAEFVYQIASIHLECDEDPTVAAILARCLGNCEHPRAAGPHLYRWQHSAKHPLTDHEIMRALERLHLPLEMAKPQISPQTVSKTKVQSQTLKGCMLVTIVFAVTIVGGITLTVMRFEDVMKGFHVRSTDQEIEILFIADPEVYKYLHQFDNSWSLIDSANK